MQDNDIKIMKSDADDTDVGATDIDQHVRRLKDELADMIALNADIQSENQKKDQLQEARDGQLKKLREIFQSDAEQLELVSYNAVNISHTTLSIHTCTHY